SDDINVDQGWELTYDTDVLGISDIEKNNTINIFPNPAQDKIQIISEETPLTAIEIINIQGQVIHRGKIDFKRNLEVDISSFSSGMYFVRLTNSMNLISIQKIILNK
ncbi:MAG: T9SS type A sorting domain-containing protein, partial [Bacteroidales bacterium]|nr:T9SS type A sorting domain-containing protein [Bacteroidales bacterium]